MITLLSILLTMAAAFPKERPHELVVYFTHECTLPAASLEGLMRDFYGDRPAVRSVRYGEPATDEVGQSIIVKFAIDEETYENDMNRLLVMLSNPPLPDHVLFVESYYMVNVVDHNDLSAVEKLAKLYPDRFGLKVSELKEWLENPKKARFLRDEEVSKGKIHLREGDPKRAPYQNREL
jgi:hypothetical protein